MTRDQPLAPLVGGVGLLERAIGYLLGALHPVTAADLATPTPCSSWDLRALLTHLDESLLALHEAVSVGHVSLAPVDPRAPDPVAAIRDRARRLLGEWIGTWRPEVLVGDAALTTGIVATTGAMEVAVHGWDVARSVGHARPLPPALAAEMLELAPLLVTDADRPARFADPVAIPATTDPGERLLAFLGRHP